MGVGRPLELGGELLAGHFPSKLPESLVGSPGSDLGGITPRILFSFFLSFFLTKLNNKGTVSISTSM